jgi:hypothetical protein
MPADQVAAERLSGVEKMLALWRFGFENKN